MSLTLERVRLLTPPQRIIPFDEVGETIHGLQEQGTRVLIANGVYDLLHRGHIRFAQAGHDLFPEEEVVVIAGLENDNSVRKNKGVTRPVNDEGERAEVMSNLRPVDLVFVYPDTPDYDKPEDFLDRYRALKQPSGILAATFDGYLGVKEWQAKETGTQIFPVSYQYENSTTKMLRDVGYE